MFLELGHQGQVGISQGERTGRASQAQGLTWASAARGVLGARSLGDCKFPLAGRRLCQGVLRAVRPLKKAGVRGLVCYPALVDLCPEDEGRPVGDAYLGGKRPELYSQKPPGLEAWQQAVTERLLCGVVLELRGCGRERSRSEAETRIWGRPSRPFV